MAKKHNRVKYILSCSASDTITLLQEGIYIYVIGENCGHGYISMMVINTESKCIDGEIFADSNDMNDRDSRLYRIIDLDIQEQYNTLIQYIY